MEYMTTDDYYCDTEYHNTLDDARAFAIERAERIGDENYPVTVSMVVPLEVYKFVEPVIPEPTVVCTCVTARTCIVNA